nr:GGDEF domain-containing phosphodiesterase [Oceanirhabdus seepicola]
MKLNEAYLDLKENNEEITAVYEELTATEEELRDQYENLKEQSISLEESQQRYKLVAEGSNDIIWDVDWRKGNLFISDRVEEIIGVKSKEIKTIKDYAKLIYEEDRKKTLEKFYKHLKYDDEYQDEYRLVSKDGQIKWILCKSKIQRDLNNQPIKIAGSASDITDKKLYEKRIEKMAYYDDLTNLYNRNGCTIQINNKLNEIKNKNSGNIAVFLLDLDNFKNINDIYGHSAGDYILQKVAPRIMESSKENELFARFGGDEFIAIIYDYPNLEYVEERAKDILNKFKEPFYLKSKEIFITASIGIAVNTSEKTNSDELFKNADSAMYRAKIKGKNSFCFFNKDLYEKNMKRLSIEEDLNKAIKKNEFFLVYQPKINIKSNKVEGFEALIRWNHPSKGIIPPMEFIPIAEQTGLIREIDFWVMEEVFTQLKSWEKKGIDMGVISLNISPNQLKDTKIINRVKKLIKEIYIDINKIQIEITENMFIESFENAKDIVLKLKELGFKISLDDFGKGYSSLNYLKWLPIDVLKIDKSFVDGIHNDEYELIDLIISLAHRLKLEIVAEGVEYYDQYEYLKNNKCDVIQGYYIAKPLSIEDAEKFIVNFTNVD